MKQKKKHFKKQLLKKRVEYPEAKMKMEQKIREISKRVSPVVAWYWEVMDSVKLEWEYHRT